MSDVQKILTQFSSDTIAQAKKHLQSSPRRQKHKRINTTGSLSKSLRGTLKNESKGISLTFHMNDYGVHMDRGIMGSKRKILKYWNKSIFLPRGKGYSNKMPPVRTIQTWMNKKGIDGNPFSIALNIKRNGVGPTLFFTDAFEKYEKDLPDDVLIGFGEDIEEILNED